MLCSDIAHGQLVRNILTSNSETAAGENATSYFPILDQIASGAFSDASTDAELYDKFINALKAGEHITSPEALSTFNLALSLRSAAPRIEAHYQYYDAQLNSSQISESCEAWIEYKGKQYCEASLQTHGGGSASHFETISFDRTLGTGDDAILYADPTSAAFKPFHESLSKKATSAELRYRLRYRRPQNKQTKSLAVSGYGVELALKRTDYIVIDDRDASENDKPSKKTQAEASLETEDEEEISDITPLSSSDLEALGMKAASFIQQSTTPFETLAKLTQDFPRYSSTIAKHQVPEEFAEQYEKAAEERIPRGANFLWVNGVQLIDRQIQPQALINMMRRERSIINNVQDLGFSIRDSISLLSHDAIAESKNGGNGGIRYDWTDKQDGGHAILWLNDLENDEQYERYPKTPQALLQRAYPGSIPPVAINAFQVVVPVDLSQLDDVALTGQLLSLIERGIPVRFGIVPVIVSEDGASSAKTAHYVKDTYGAEGIASFIEAKAGRSSDRAAFDMATGSTEIEPENDALDFAGVQDAERYDNTIKAIKSWQARLAALTEKKFMLVNGAILPRSESWMQSLGQQISEDLRLAQQAIFDGRAEDKAALSALFLTDVVQRRNEYLSNGDETPTIVDVTDLQSSFPTLFKHTVVIPCEAGSSKETWASVLVAADLETKEGRELVVSALEHKRKNPGVELRILHNVMPGAVDGGKTHAGLALQADALAVIVDESELLKLINSLPDASVPSSVWQDVSLFLGMCKFAAGDQFVLLNGRTVGPIRKETPFVADDFQQLFEIELRARILPVYSALEALNLDGKLADASSAAKLTSLVARSTESDIPEGIFDSAPSGRTAIFNSWSLKHATIEVGNPDTAKIHFVGLVNPLSDQGQKYTAVLKSLSSLDGIYLKLFLNPNPKVTELPVKRFFRYVLDPKPTFGSDGSVSPQTASFQKLPTEALLTAAMDVPPAWLVSAKSSVYDLDNIKLSTSKSDVDAVYELEHILIEGHSRETEGGAPRGTQLVLKTMGDDYVADTLVMANLGFFQFKANPGVYNIELQDGRSADIYTIESVGSQGYSAVEGDAHTRLVLMDFEGTTLYPRLKRKPGKEDEDVLEESEGTIISKGFKFAEGILGGLGKSASAKEHADINIFSVASGHLYERMLNIMMVSVMKNTKHTVKFWFIEQFLSPSFKEFIPKLAEEYGFKYEMVTYKWPHWLRQQKEKQREIWGYKILFLDVLFPLSLDKVIFVDADQIVRTDMMDLVNLDLEGAPYGFTPMCDSRTEMEGFRFWKQGYWELYLRGKPYHISALYVVDLRRFRELAAGDRLRQQYHSLSADPNSLANLDQDLPNHMQFQIPIHSLPQEWLWCETWCSDESQTSARTIDLCNNPETKEPKLDRARRQVPEWTVYDDEIAALATRHSSTRQSNTKSRNWEEPVHTRDEL